MKIGDINVSDDALEEMSAVGSSKKNRLILKHRLSNGKIRNVDVQSGFIGHKDENVLCSIIQDITLQKRPRMHLLIVTKISVKCWMLKGMNLNLLKLYWKK
jgi:hypothetical protein